MNTTTTYLITENISFITETIKFLAGVLAPLLAGYIGVRYGLKQIKVQKRIDLIENQLNNFYSPLLGLSKEIRAKSELRLKIKQLGDKAWAEKCEQFRMGPNQPDITPYTNEIEYNNEQLRIDFLPKYNKMLDIFRNNYWLSELETRDFYPQLVEFVEIWNRNFNKGLPPDVAKKINHSEEKLKIFYDELELRTNKLRKELLKIN